MKKLLITGANSYIGTSFEAYMNTHYPNEVCIHTIDMIDGKWRDTDFSEYDVVFHVAGIAHADVSNVTEEVKHRYYSVNTDLAIETAQKAKSEGVRQFIFMSSIIIYGGIPYVTEETAPCPANFYGDSKWQADKGIRELETDDFKVVVLRPPMIYGKGSRGNYPSLAKLARKLPVFPRVENERSILYIENLCEFIRIMIDEERSGIFFPQNSKTVSTSELVGMIAETKQHRIRIWAALSPFVSLGKLVPGRIGGLCRKAFGDSSYDIAMSDIGREYCVVDLRESIRRTEGEK